MMSNPKFLRTMSGVLFGIGAIAIVDGYAEFASGEEGLVRLLLLPTAMFLTSYSMFQRSRKEVVLSETDDA